MSDMTKIVTKNQKEMLKVIAPMTKTFSDQHEILIPNLEISPWLERPPL